MRRIHRPVLPGLTQAYLNRRKVQTLGQPDVDQEWKAARQTRTFVGIVRILYGMMGQRERCMYCVDSHGSDIDHFWPKSRYPERSFDWDNMLLSCTECGRFKGSQFPLRGDGRPLLVDPCVEDPWSHIDFDPETGNLVPRYDLATGQPSAKGESTVQVLQLDRREGMSAGYRRTHLRIVKRVTEALEQPDLDTDVFLTDLLQADDHGLLGWCFKGNGVHLQPFVELRRRLPQLWKACLDAIAR